MKNTYNAPVLEFQRTPGGSGNDAVIYGNPSQAPAPPPTVQYDQMDDGILTTQDFVQDLPQNTQLTFGIASIIVFFYVANIVGDMGTIIYVIGLCVVYFLRKQWRWADAERRELEYYGKLRFPIFVLQVDKRNAIPLINAVEPLESRFKGISCFYSNRVLRTAKHYREMLKHSENQVLKDTDVIEIYYQDVSTKASAIETADEYAVRAANIVVAAVSEYKSRLAENKDTAWVKKYFYNQ